MMKKLLALLLAVVLGAALLVPALAEDNTPTATEGYYYVYTENGKSLNVRATPGGEKVGSLKYGSRIYCYYRDGGNGWALIDYTYDMPGVGRGTYACYVSSRFLVKNKPAPRSSSSGSASKSTAADPMTEINAQFRSAKAVAPFVVYTRPTRASGWVDLRWAPSKSAEVMATYKSNQALTVIRELTSWYQVEDPATGVVGFIDKAFTVQ